MTDPANGPLSPAALAEARKICNEAWDWPPTNRDRACDWAHNTGPVLIDRVEDLEAMLSEDELAWPPSRVNAAYAKLCEKKDAEIARLRADAETRVGELVIRTADGKVEALRSEVERKWMDVYATQAAAIERLRADVLTPAEAIEVRAALWKAPGPINSALLNKVIRIAAGTEPPTPNTETPT